MTPGQQRGLDTSLKNVPEQESHLKSRNVSRLPSSSSSSAGCGFDLQTAGGGAAKAPPPAVESPGDEKQFRPFQPLAGTHFGDKFVFLSGFNFL